jgi:hypothetical protein
VATHRADRLLEQALEQDSDFASAWELLAPIPALAIGLARLVN